MSISTAFISFLLVFSLSGCYQNKENESLPTQYCLKPKYSDLFPIPKELVIYFDYKQGVYCANSARKPIFLTFTGLGAMCCSEYYFQTWLKDKTIFKLLKENYIVIALYVDDPKMLDTNDFYVSKLSNKVIKTRGKKNAEFQISKYNVNSQPYSLVLDNFGHELLKPMNYTGANNEIIDYLKAGITEFNKKRVIASQ